MIVIFLACVDGGSGSSVDSATDTDPVTGGTDSATDSGSVGDAPDLSTLTDVGGCADVVMYQSSPDRTLVLVFHYDGEVAKRAFESSSSTASDSPDLGGPATLELWQGTQVTDLVCNDALTGTEVVDRAWLATSGAAQIEVVSDGTSEPWGAYPGEGTLTLTDVVMEGSGEEDVSFSTRTWTAGVGWLPG